MSASGEPRGAAAILLIVDADPSLRTTAQLHLAAAGGVEIREAADAAEAWTILRSQRVDAVVGRAHGPRFDGTAFLARLRADPDPRLRSVAVVLVAETVPEEVATLLARHPPAVGVAAPVTGPRLAAAVRRLLRR